MCYCPRVDFARPVEALIPGVQGRVLAVLANTDSELTMRTVATLSGVSSNRASQVLNRLVSLGLVERRDVGNSALVRLSRQSEAARLVAECADLHSRVIHRMRSEAKKLRPAPSCLLAFGSFARREARDDSDIDILAVIDGVGAEQIAATESMGRWSDTVMHMTGNPVNLIQVSSKEIPGLLKRGSFWRDVARGAIVLAGTPPIELGVIE